jgi:hypothetical protein
MSLLFPGRGRIDMLHSGDTDTSPFLTGNRKLLVKKSTVYIINGAIVKVKIKFKLHLYGKYNFAKSSLWFYAIK